MKEKLIKNGIIFGVAVVISVILTLAVTGFSWSFRTFSDMLTYSGIVIFAYGAYVAANLSNMFSGLKKNLNERYSPEEKKEKERVANSKLVDGWLMVATGAILFAISVLVVRI